MANQLANIVRIFLDRPYETPIVPTKFPAKAVVAREKQKVRFVCMSDTHSCWPTEVPEGDVLIHAGDLTLGGRADQSLDTLARIAALPHPIKIVVAGNHDLALDAVFVDNHDQALSKYQIHSALQKDLRDKFLSAQSGIVYLEHETTRIRVRGREFKIFGSPYSPEFSDFAFMYPKELDVWSLETSEPSKFHPALSSIEEQTDIVITHGPPKGVMDQVLIEGCAENVGCPFLTTRIEHVKPALHVFGHIHEGAAQGMVQRIWKNGTQTTFINAALLDAAYKPAYGPTVYDL